ncbi:uncharacterized protein LOC113658275 isoform X3 [Tachysurus fulvidraco]|uniref:uncharacterized protein LOC113658275 isoform X3 n=1 Tax=Tachysurus fulvidraco TaxID=1234273 RepID=UPI001FF022DC|nr:uncharacterized protein LOC113658275 isoform X3 [Tachysurus fulvidraco]
MMKSILIFTLSLISGPAGCAVTGYSGGSVLIISDLKWGSGFSRYICIKGSISCTDIIHTNNTENSVQLGRFMLYESREGFFIVLIRRLEPQDAGTYTIGGMNGTKIDVSLTVNYDSCCDGPKTVKVFSGQNISITSNYPVVYNLHYKYIMKLENGSVSNAVLDTYSETQKNRFTISDDRSAKVLGMNISNVTEADDGVYFCGFFNRENSIQYYSFFREIHLHVRESSVKTTTTTTIIIIIIISVCVLLIGGFTLLVIYKLTHERAPQVSRPSSQDNEHAPSVHENNLPNLPPNENLNIKMRLNGQNLDSSTNQSDSTYQTLDPLTNQSDSGYMSLSNTADQSHSHYQCLNARTQVNSFYQTLHS